MGAASALTSGVAAGASVVTGAAARVGSGAVASFELDQ